MAQITFEYDTSKPIFSKLNQDIPNSETVEAIKEARAGKNRRFTSFDELIKDLEN